MCVEKKELVHKIKSFTKSTYWLTPINYDKEKKRFLENTNINPQFAYPSLPRQEIEAFVAKINESIDTNINYKNESGEEITNNKLKELFLKLNLFLSIGNAEKLTSFSKKLYLVNLDNSQQNEAKKILSEIKNDNESDEINKEALVHAVDNYLNQNKLSGWKVIPTNHEDFTVRIASHIKTIYIGKQIFKEVGSIDSIIAHELDVHVARKINAENQVEIYQNPLPFYIKTEEGLATYVSDLFSKNSDIPKKQHAVKYLACRLAIDAPFRKVYDFFRSHGFSENFSFQRAFRIKRGFTDSSQKGINAREAIYFEGFIDVKKYIENEKNIEKLYYGKIGIKDIPFVPRPKKLYIPKRISNIQKGLKTT